MKQLDPVTLEILRARLVSLVDEAAATFKRASFSTLVREANDFAVVLADARGRGVAQYSKGIPSFLGTIPRTIKAFMSVYPPEALSDGDVLITNDPWIGTGHIHDVSIVVPIFLDDDIVGYAGISTHLPDIGGQIRSASCTEIFEEGLQIPLLKLYDAGSRNETLFAMIRRNVRVPEQTIGDILGAVSGCRTLSAKLSSVLRHEAVDFQAFAETILERSEAAMRKAIEAIPDGAYHHVVQHDGFEERITIDCTVVVKGSDIAVDFTGTSPQLPRAVNVVPNYTFAYTAYGLKAILAPELPNNEGTLYPLSTDAPEGTILNPVYPAASGARGMIGHMLPTAVMGALAPVLGDRVGAEGSANSSFTIVGEHRGRSFAVANFVNAGQGATAARDGQSVLSFPSNLGNTPVEVLESLAPVRVHRREIRSGSGGAGQHKGGDGLSLAFEFLGETPARCSFLTTRRIVAPKGAAGGGNGKVARVLINDREIDTTGHQVLKKGDVVLYETAGGGGYGAP